MSAEAGALRRWDTNSGRKGLRVALAVAVGFTWSVASGDVLPFLAPLFASQFLLASPRPLSWQKALGMVLLIAVVGFSLQFLMGVMRGRPFALLTLLGLFYFACYHRQAAGRGGPAVFLVLVVSVMMPLLTLLNYGLGGSVLSIMLKGVASGVLLTWIAHALISHGDEADPPPAPAVKYPRPALRALANTVILLLSVTICLTSSRFSTAIVIPVTVASMLMQIDIAASAKAAAGLMLVNLLGGIAAMLAFALVELRPSLIFLFPTLLFVGLVLGGRAAVPGASGKVFAGALTIFLIVLGSGVSPLPGSAAESFVSRIGFVTFAIAYTMLTTTLLWPARPKDRLQQMGAME